MYKILGEYVIGCQNESARVIYCSGQLRFQKIVV